MPSQIALALMTLVDLPKTDIHDGTVIKVLTADAYTSIVRVYADSSAYPAGGGYQVRDGVAYFVVRKRRWWHTWVGHDKIDAQFVLRRVPRNCAVAEGREVHCSEFKLTPGTFKRL